MKKVKNINSLPNFLIDSQISFFFKLALQKNFRVWLVGGAVRDFLMGSKINDIDIVIDGNPSETLNLLQKNNIFIKDKFLNYGTFILKFDEINCNLTCLRKDYDHDGRHSKVVFTKSLSLDAKRRDLTVNALYLSIKGEIIDFYNGIEDIKKSRLIFIGKVNEKCLEDFLRILRYFRFCSIFKNPIIPDHYKKFFIENSCLIKNIPQKKVIDELKKIFANNYFSNSIALIKSLNLDNYLFNEVLINEKNLRKKLRKYL